MTQHALCRRTISSVLFLGLVLLFALATAHAGETSLTLNSQPGDYIGQGQQFSYSRADGAFTFYRNVWNGISVIFRDSRNGRLWMLDFIGPNNQPLTVGTYLGATGIPFPAPNTPALRVITSDYQCNIVSGSFQIKQVTYVDNTLRAFWAVFEQHCNGAVPALLGEVRFSDIVLLIDQPDEFVEPGETVNFIVPAAEVYENHVSLTATGLPSGATFTDNGNNTGRFTWTPNVSQTGVFSVTFQGDNGLGETDHETTNIVVGGTIRVPADVSTIQDGIDLAADGLTVLVAPGTYVENINFHKKRITVTSEQGPEFTIIDGNQTDSVVTFDSGEGPGSVLNGFRLRNGNSNLGGGIRISGSSPTINENIISNNEGCKGGGIAIGVGSPVIQGNTIKQNVNGGCYDFGGGGIYIASNSSPQILENVITENISETLGGGISLYGGPSNAGTPMIRGNVISGNSATGSSARGGGISIEEFSAVIVQNVITSNHASFGGGIYWGLLSGPPVSMLTNNTVAENDSQHGSGIYSAGSSNQPQLINNIIVGTPGQAAVFCGNTGGPNTAIFKYNNVFMPGGSAYGGICTDQTGTNGNISADPLFVDPLNGDFNLDVGSSSIDIGDNTDPGLPTKDILGKNRIVDGDENGQAVVDMGAYEFVPNPGFFQFASPNFSVPEDGGSANITVVRKGGKSGPVTVDFTTSDGTATAGSDYVTSSGTLVFGDGETQKTFSVPVINDQVFEGKETVNLRLSNPSGGALLGSRQIAVLTITEPGVLSFNSSTYSASENTGCAVTTVTRADGNSGDVTVHYATAGGTATPGVDYTPISGTLTFADGETSKTVCVPVLNDSLVEGTETLNLILSDATGGAVLGNSSSTELDISNTDFLSANYFPVNPGDTWTYLINGAGTVNTTVLKGNTSINGVATSAFQDTQGYKEFYTADSDGIRLHGLFYPNVLIDGLGKVNLTLTFMEPVLLAYGVADIGRDVFSSGYVTSNKLPRVGVMLFQYSARFTAEAFDNVTIPAGNFDTIRLKGTIQITGQPPSEFTFQLAQGIGIVRSTTTQQGVAQTLELVSTNVTPFTIDTSSLPDGEQNAPYLASLQISGGSGPYAVSIVSGSLPAGLTIDKDGNITGILSAQAKTATFTVRVTQRGSYVNKAFKITILKALGITTGSLKSGVSGKNYTTTFKASGGKTPYNWSLVSGSLPAGLSLNSVTGSITGVPTQTGTFTPTFRVSDVLGGQTQKSFTLTIK